MMDSGPACAGGSRRRGRSKFVSTKWFLRVAALAALAAVTVWNVTRSDALAAAERAYERGNHARALGLALDHLHRRPWSRAANLVAARALWRLHDGVRAEPYALRAGPLGPDDQRLRRSARPGPGIDGAATGR